MSRRKSIKLAAQTFSKSVGKIEEFFATTASLNKEWHSWCTEYAAIRLYREFEVLMLSALVGAVNNDTTTLADATGCDFPAHLSQNVCTYIIVGNGYFDFKGRDGLIKLARRFVPELHYLVKVLKAPKYKDALEQLSALRNFAAHGSTKAKRMAIKAIGGERIGSAGSWLKSKNRFVTLCSLLKELSHAIEEESPY
jgi:hypothetical protein